MKARYIGLVVLVLLFAIARNHRRHTADAAVLVACSGSGTCNSHYSQSVEGDNVHVYQWDLDATMPEDGSTGSVLKVNNGEGGPYVLQVRTPGGSEMHCSITLRATDNSDGTATFAESVDFRGQNGVQATTQSWSRNGKSSHLVQVCTSGDSTIQIPKQVVLAIVDGTPVTIKLGK